MPLYTVTTPDGLLSAQQRDAIAAELVRIHTAAMHVPANFVHSIFPTYPPSHAYVAAERSPVSSIVGVIRAGHTSERSPGSFNLSGTCSRTRRGYPIATFP